MIALIGIKTWARDHGCEQSQNPKSYASNFTWRSAKNWCTFCANINWILATSEWEREKHESLCCFHQIVFLINQFEYNLSVSVCQWQCHMPRYGWQPSIFHRFRISKFLLSHIFFILFILYALCCSTQMQPVSNGFYVSYKRYLIMCTTKWILYAFTLVLSHFSKKKTQVFLCEKSWRNFSIFSPKKNKMKIVQIAKFGAYSFVMSTATAVCMCVCVSRIIAVSV